MMRKLSKTFAVFTESVWHALLWRSIESDPKYISQNQISWPISILICVFSLFINRSAESAAPFWYVSSPLPVVQVSSLLPFPRNCFKWLVSMIATQQLVAQPQHWVTLPRPLMRPLPRLTLSWHQTCGRKCHSTRPHTRNTPISWKRQPRPAKELLNCKSVLGHCKKWK